MAEFLLHAVATNALVKVTTAPSEMRGGQKTETAVAVGRAGTKPRQLLRRFGNLRLHGRAGG